MEDMEDTAGETAAITGKEHWLTMIAGDIQSFCHHISEEKAKEYTREQDARDEARGDSYPKTPWLLYHCTPIAL